MQSTTPHRPLQHARAMAKNKDDELALFNEVQRRRSQRRHAIQPPGDYVEDEARTVLSSIAYRTVASSTSAKPREGEDIFTSDLDKNDYDWLLTPPGTPLITTSHQDAPGADIPLKGTYLVRSLASLKTSKLGNATEPPTQGVRQLNSTSSDEKLKNAPKRTSLASTASTNTGSRSVIPTRRSAASCTTPTGKVAVCFSAVTPATSSRSSTPGSRPTTPTLNQNQSSGTTSRSTSVSKANSFPSKSSSSSRGASPTSRSRPWQPSAIPGFASEAPPNLCTTITDRSTSNSRGTCVGLKQGLPSTVGTSGGSRLERSSGARTQSGGLDGSKRLNRQSHSSAVSRGYLAFDGQNNNHNNLCTGNGTNGVLEISTPIVAGSKMVERLMQARRSAALVQEERPSNTSNSHVFSQIKQPVKSTTANRDSSGFGRNISKKSLDMALRHMDIRQNMPGEPCQLMSNIPVSSIYSVRDGMDRGKPYRSATHFPVTTSNNTSSEHSFSVVPDPEGSEQGEKNLDRRALPGSQPDSDFFLSKDAKFTNWINSSDYRDDSVEIMQLFKQGIERFSGSESPLVCQHGRASDCDRCKLGPR